MQTNSSTSVRLGDGLEYTSVWATPPNMLISWDRAPSFIMTFLMAINKNKSKERNKIANLSKYNTHITLEIMWKTQNRKNHGVACKFTIIERLQGDKEEDLISVLYNSSMFSSHTLIRDISFL